AGAGPERVQEAYSEQVAQVGDHPVGTGLDERVVVQLREVGGDHVALLAEDLQQRLEDPTLAGLDVPLVVDHRQQVGELVAQAGPDEASVTVRPPAARNMSCAGTAAAV